ncbi:Protein Y51F10.11 [Aphelenchoides avenae]|nr:Protein Y51F10.11 [Aphelenchus avenae]
MNISFPFGGYTILFVITLLLLVAILCGMFGYRQIRRLRKNSARKDVSSTVATKLSKKGRQAILSRIEAVDAFRKMHVPKFTDCTIIAQHANAPYKLRMIAFDEVLFDVDRQLEVINPDLTRRPGESTYSFLKRVKVQAIPSLEDKFIERIGFLHECCRYRTEMEFGEKELTELRALLREFVRILNANQAELTSLKVKAKSRSLENKSDIVAREAAGKTQSLPDGRRLQQEETPLLLATPDDSNSSPSNSPFRNPVARRRGAQ